MTCGILRIYIYDILFNPNENSKIQDKKRLNKRTIETVLNELFVLDDQDTNEATIQQYANENNVFLQRLTVLLLQLVVSIVRETTDSYRLKK